MLEWNIVCHIQCFALYFVATSAVEIIKDESEMKVNTLMQSLEQAQEENNRLRAAVSGKEQVSSFTMHTVYVSDLQI